jgi:hypothetical protein
MHRLPGAGHVLQQALCMRPKRLAGKGQLEPIALALEEAHAEGILQGFDPGAHGRLAEEQDFSGTPEPPECHHSDERLQLIDFHRAALDRLPFLIAAIKTISLTLCP